MATPTSILKQSASMRPQEMASYYYASPEFNQTLTSSTGIPSSQSPMTKEDIQARMDVNRLIQFERTSNDKYSVLAKPRIKNEPEQSRYQKNLALKVKRIRNSYSTL